MYKSNYLYILCTFMDFINSEFINTSSIRDNLYHDDLYGDGYGTKWIYFPDGDGVLHFVNLTRTENDVLYVRNMADDIEFRLYTWKNPGSYVLLDELGSPVDKGNKILTSKIMLSNLPLKIITHGWRSSADQEGVLTIKKAYLEAKNAIVITVDWSITAESILYHWVANETKTVGVRIASFLHNLSNRYNVTGKQIHLIGHSLGAHVMGIAASTTKMIIGRITGLDPARPYFEYPPQDASARLDSSDAEFVDVIHTCGGLLGFEAAIGTADFYPNNGIAPQPGCDNILKFFEACSHGRSFFYFTESIKYPKSFPAYQCQNWVEFLENRCSQFGFMGENVNKNISGKYYLKTNAFEPFGKQTS